MSFEGLLLIDKPRGCTSHDVVKEARRILGIRSIGHAGTLDPLATGLLVLMVGQATKLSDFIVAGVKKYRMKIKMGVETDTLDSDGKILRQVEGVSLSSSDFEDALSKLQGNLELPVPLYSAVKVNGKKLYDLARREIQVTPPLRTMSFFDLQVLKVGPDWIELEMGCEKGSYVRAWAHRLGELLQVGAMVEELRRLRIEPFSVEEALTLEDLREMGVEKGHPGIISLAEALPHWKSFQIFGREEELMSNGLIPKPLAQKVHIWRRENAQRDFGVRVFSGSSGKLLSLLTFREGSALHVQRVFV